MITEQQYQRLMTEYAKSGVQGTAAMKAGMHRETAAKYLSAGHGSQPEKKRGRRRPDPLTAIWPAAERLLADAPELEAKALFEHLLANPRPGASVRRWCVKGERSPTNANCLNVSGRCSRRRWA